MQLANLCLQLAFRDVFVSIFQSFSFILHQKVIWQLPFRAELGQNESWFLKGFFFASTGLNPRALLNGTMNSLLCSLANDLIWEQCSAVVWIRAQIASSHNQLERKKQGIFSKYYGAGCAIIIPEHNFLPGTTKEVITPSIVNKVLIFVIFRVWKSGKSHLHGLSLVLI